MDVGDLDPDPLVQFGRWKSAYSGGDDSACLATASADGVPNARMVLVKGGGAEGLVVFTNRTSAKGRELEENPRAALVFHWDPRSVRVAGAVEVVDEAVSDAYWDHRPRGSRLGAWASDQSAVIEHRRVLEHRLNEVEERFRGQERVPRPPQWGGYRIVPDWIEFWQHRDDRLHDRIRYRRGEGTWRRERLAP